MATLDVIIPFDIDYGDYNVKCINSLKKIVTDDINFIVVCSLLSDIESLDKRLKSYIKPFYENYSNVYDAFNIGISKSTADYIAFLEPTDEFLEPYKFITRCTNNVDWRIFQTKKKTLGVTTLSARENDDVIGLSSLKNSVPSKTIDCIKNKLYKRSIIAKNSINFYKDCSEPELIFNLLYLSKANNYDVIDKCSVALVEKKKAEYNLEEKEKRNLKSLAYVKQAILNCSEGEKRNFLLGKKDFFSNIAFYENIDLVFLYVTSEDEDWQQKYRVALHNNGRGDDVWATGIERFRDPGTLKYLFRSIAKNMPWIRKVHMVVMSKNQVPSFVNTDEVDIITHDQFIPKRLLPTFNSSTIEMFLSKLPRVANKFIYSNDDIFYPRPLEPQFFFDGGKPIYQVILRNFSKTAPGDQMRLNDYNLYFGITQKKRVVTTQHGPITFKKAWISECYKRFEPEMIASCTQFRTETDLNQYLYALYQMMEKEVVNTKQKFKCYELNDRSFRGIINDDFSKYDAICLNDSITSTKEQWQCVLDKFEAMFPEKCKYEK